MARSSQGSFVDNHIEKVVLAICALALLVTLFGSVLSSEKFEAPVLRGKSIGTVELPPEQIDEQLAQTAAGLRAAVESRQDPNVEPVPDYARAFARRLESPLWPRAAQLTRMVNFGQPAQPLARLDPNDVLPDTRVTVADLEKLLPAPARPVVEAQTVLPETPEPKDVGLLSGVSIYPVGQHQTDWFKVLQGLGIPATPIVLNVEAEIRQRKPDGTWAEPKKMPIVRVAQGEGNQLTAVTVQEVMPPLPAYDGENLEAIRQVLQTISSPSIQEFIVQGGYFPVFWGPTREWISPAAYLPDNEISRQAATDPDLLRGATPRRGATVVRKAPAPAPRDRRTTRTPRDMPPEWLDEMEGPYGPAGPVGPVPSRPPKQPSGTPADPKEVTVAPPPPPRPMLTLAQQMAIGKMAVVVRNDQIEPGKEYSIRLRLQYLNPVYGQEMAVKDPADARKASVATPWSPWSESFRLPQTTRFFLTGASPQQGTVKVTVFSRSLGQRVQRSFNVRRGQPIGGKAALRVPDPITGEVREVEVDFSTGATAVDFDFEKRVLKGTFSTSTVEMLILDETGELMTRVRAWDEDSKEYKNLRDETRQAEATARAAP